MLAEANVSESHRTQDPRPGQEGAASIAVLRPSCGDSNVFILPARWTDTCQEEEGMEYLQFSCPLTDLYSELFDVPSGLLFWRVPLRKGAGGELVLEGGQIISERNQL